MRNKTPQRNMEPPDPPPTWTVTGLEQHTYRVTRQIVARTRAEAETLFLQRNGDIQEEEFLYAAVDVGQSLDVEKIF